MKKLDKKLAYHMTTRGTVSFAINRPLAVSFELTHSCTCNCRHCDHGGKKWEEEQLTADQYRELERELKPILLQLSGGEPLMRDDFFDIVDAVKEESSLPYLIVVSNGSLLTEEIYLKAVEKGVNQFSISLDFPDERHDDFRRHPGLYQHLTQLIPKLTAHNCGNIVMNTAITRWNLPYLEDCYNKAKEWGANISYSAYTTLRTEDNEYDIKDPEDLKLLKKKVDRLLEIKHSNGRIANSDWTLSGTYEFFKKGEMPGCKAGLRSMVINPNGTMRPCSMYNHQFKDRSEMYEKFVKNNKCGACYVSIRAYLGESYWTLLSQNIRERVLGKVDEDGSCSL